MYNRIPIQSAIKQDGDQGKAIQVIDLGIDTTVTGNYPSRNSGWERSNTGSNAWSTGGRERRGRWNLVRVR